MDRLGKMQRSGGQEGAWRATQRAPHAFLHSRAAASLLLVLATSAAGAAVGAVGAAHRAVPKHALRRRAGVGRDVVARGALLPQRLEHVAAVAAVVWAEQRLERLCGLGGVVVRHLREEVVRDVRVGDVVEEVVEHAVAVARACVGVLCVLLRVF